MLEFLVNLMMSVLIGLDDSIVIVRLMWDVLSN